MRLRGIRLRYGGTDALAGVDCKLPSKGLVVLFGPNGAGKTSLLDVLAGAVKPTSGEIVDGAGAPMLPARLARWAARMFQRTLVPSLTPADLLEFAAHYERPEDLWRQPKPVALAEGEEALLREAGVDKRMSARLAELSGGQQRVCMLVATLLRPCRVLLLDEPLAGIGSSASDLVAGLMRREADRRLVVVVDHESARLFPLADLLLGMRGGRLALQGIPATIGEAAIEDLYRV